MFGAVKALWQESELTTSIDGILREVESGNAVEAQRWYFKLKKDCRRQAIAKGTSSDKIEEGALATLPLAKRSKYMTIVRALAEPGGVFAEIDEWLKNNNP